MVRQCTFNGNAGGAGPAVNLGNSSPVITDCVFLRNVAVAGGAINSECSNYQMKGCTLAWNVAAHGGGIACGDYDTVQLVNCTLYANQAADGAGILCQIGTLQIENSIIAFNVKGSAITCDDAQATFTCCDLYHNQGGDWVDCAAGQQGTNGNLCLDPLFCGAADGNFDLQGNSPCGGHTPPSPDCDLMGAWPTGCSTGLREVELIPPRASVRVSPNPCFSSCRIFWRGGDAQPLRLEIFDAAGRLVRAIYRGESSPGVHSWYWDGTGEAGLPSPAGIYLVRAAGPRTAASTRIVKLP